MISFSSGMLDLTSNHRIDLDVFLCNSEFNLSNYTGIMVNGKCCIMVNAVFSKFLNMRKIFLLPFRGFNKKVFEHYVKIFSFSFNESTR